MRTMRPIHDESCSVAACAEIIGAKWTALLVHDLSEGPRRFSELEHSCAGISPRTLSERLRALEDEGIVARHSYAESPPRVEYELTDKGDALLPIIEEMRRSPGPAPKAAACDADMEDMRALPGCPSSKAAACDADMEDMRALAGCPSNLGRQGRCRQAPATRRRRRAHQRP